MGENRHSSKRHTRAAAAVALCALLHSSGAQGITINLFSPPQPAAHSASGATSETISCDGYLITYTLDKYWSPTGPGGTPTGRPESILWPKGVGAQAQTAGPGGPITTQVPATITIKRVDKKPFDLKSFTAKIFGNTAATGASIEIMPLLNGNDGFQDPLALDATGYGGASFSYTTPTLTGFDTYKISLWMDFGLTSLTLVDASVAIPVPLQISMTSSNYVRVRWPADAFGFALLSSTNAVRGPFVVQPVLPVIEGSDQSVYLPKTNSLRVFRLSQ